MEPVKETPKDKVAVKETVQAPIVLRTEMENYLSDIIASQPKTVEEMEIRDFTPENGAHRLSLPKKIEEKYGKKYAFRWVNKKKDWLDRATIIRKWMIVNRVFMPDLPKYLFTAIGTIENGDAILCFMPIAKAERLRKEPGNLSRERVQDLPMEKWKNAGEDSPFYKPSLGQEEKDGEIISAGIQPDVQTQT